MIPTRSAAVALLTFDVILLAVPLFIRGQNWFVFAYIPLLLTVALGVLMSGRGRLALILTGIVIPLLAGSLWAVCKLAPANIDLLGTTLHVGGVALACLVVMWFGLAAWGWVRFFTGRPAVA